MRWAFFVSIVFSVRLVLASCLQLTELSRVSYTLSSVCSWAPPSIRHHSPSSTIVEKFTCKLQVKTQLFSEVVIPNPPFGNKQFHHSLSWALNSSHQRCSSINGLRVHFCAVLKQKLNKILLTRVASVMEWSPLEIISRIYVGPEVRVNITIKI